MTRLHASYFQKKYDQYNRRFFDCSLPRCVVKVLPPGNSMVLGTFFDDFSIHIYAHKDVDRKKGLGILLHEMCHVKAFLKDGDLSDPHGPTWKREMRKVGFEKVNRHSGMERFPTYVEATRVEGGEGSQLRREEEKKIRTCPAFLIPSPGSGEEVCSIHR